MKNTILTTEQVSNQVSNAMESVKKDSKKATLSLDYNPKKVKIDFDASKELKLLCCKHYSESKFMGSINNYANNNKKYYNSQIQKLAKVENPTDEQKEEVNAMYVNIATINACLRTFRRKQNAVINEICNVWAFDEERILKAYYNRFDNETEWKNALGEFFKRYGITMSDSMFKFLDKNVGSKSSSLNKKLKGEFLDGYKGKALYMLLMDCLVDLAIRKGKIAWSTIEELKGEKLLAINEFNDYIVVDAMSVINTKAEIMETLDKAGVEYKSSAKKDTLLKVYTKAVKDGVIVER